MAQLLLCTDIHSLTRDSDNQNMKDHTYVANNRKNLCSSLDSAVSRSTLAIAQSQSPSWHYTTPSQTQAQAQAQMVAQVHPQSRYMTCMADDGKGNCTAAAQGNGPTEVVHGEGLIMGDRMLCTD